MIKRAQIRVSKSLVLFRIRNPDVGQAVLRGQIPPNATHWQLDDTYMGVGLAPLVYGLAPCVLLALIGSALLLSHRLQHRS